MSFWTKIIEGIKGKGKDKISGLVESTADRTSPEQTTAAKEFDMMPFMYGMFDFPVTRSGFVAEVRDAWTMYKEDDRVRATIDSIGDDATQLNRNGVPFNILVKDTEGEITDNAIELSKQLYNKINALKIYQRCSDIIKFSLIEGSRFYRLVVDFARNEIVELRHIKGPKDGFVIIKIEEGEYKDCYVQIESQSQKAITAFLPWEIVRFDWNKPDEDPYGMGLYASGRKNFKRLDKTEYDLFVARKARSYPKMARKYPNATLDDIRKIMDADQESRKKYGADAIEKDIYTTGDVALLEAQSTAILNINDVEYSQRKLLASGRRPAALLGGFGYDAVNRAVLDRQESRYTSGFLSSVEEMFNTGIKSLFDLQLILWGFLPQDWNIILEWTKKNIEDKAILLQAARDGIDRRALPLSVYSQLFDMNKEDVYKEIETDLERLAQWEETFGLPIVDKRFQSPQG